ncbi:MAG: nuclear transport factor 2 family protein [Pseudomonadota bacterium]
MTPAARTTLTRWHDIVAQRDLKALPAIVHPDAVFRSPVAHTPYPGAFALCLALNTVIQVFEDFTYHREFFSEADNSAVLEFSASVDGKSLKGIDMIRFDDDGLITEFEVMIRPKNALEALAAEMGARIGAQMTAMKETN